MQVVLILSLLVLSSSALRRVSIGLTNTEEKKYDQINFENPETLYEEPSFITEAQEPDDLKTRTLLTTPASLPLHTYEEVELKQVNIRPRGGKMLKQTNRKVAPYSEHQEQRVSEPQLQGSEVFNDLQGNLYTKEELMDMCAQAKSVGDSFGIKDITSFAGNNCGLIQLYYSNVSCEEIGKFVEYCETSKNS
ncbi:unnamed protein product [Auanema sp. JU1783]|nr:unnamed protein product [Auanema sp. JU1783]